MAARAAASADAFSCCSSLAPGGGDALPEGHPALAGGSGTVLGAFLGALVLAELQNGMNLIGISANPYFLILGIAILVSMIANVYLSRLRRAGRV